MTRITITLPDHVAQEYFRATETLADQLTVIGEPPSAPALMRFILSGFTADDIAAQFNLALNLVAANPPPDERWMFDPAIETVP